MIFPLAQVQNQDSAAAQQQQQQAGSSPGGGAVHVQMLDSQQIIKYEIIEAPSPTGGTNTVTVSTGQHIGAITPTSSSGGGGTVVVASNGGDENGSDQMD